VGRGPTEFDYKDLAHVADPIFFINDAICLEKHARSETFFFAHDAELRVWLDGSVKATAVLPVNGTVLGDAPDVVLNHAGPVVYYHRRQKDGDLLRMNRDDIADRAELFGHTGTIHSLLHFAWFCGFCRVVLIGCDGIDRKHALASACGAKRGYDSRLRNKSNSTSGWHYGAIRRAQDLLTTLFGIEAIYRGTPVLPDQFLTLTNRRPFNSNLGSAPDSTSSTSARK
ncbi:MAG TPA: hypothetical protein VGL71_01995, partial [Urbifossiella sp.]